LGKTEGPICMDWDWEEKKTVCLKRRHDCIA
jgi:hypothetical protein